MPDETPSDHLRVEVAFATGPDDSAADYVDLTSRLDLRAGVSVTRGRPDQFSTIQPSTCQLTLNNYDGALTAGNPSSPYYPNVKVQRRIRLSYRDPADVGNFVDNPSFEVDTTGWTGFGSGVPVRVNTVAAQDGSWEGRAAYSSGLSGIQTTVSNLTIGRTYIASGYVWNPVGNPSVGLTIGGGTSTRTNTNGVWQRLSRTFTATSGQHTLQFGVLGTGGTNLFYVDAVQVDEGTTLQAYTTGDPAVYLFTGHVDEWPLDWPNGGRYAQASIQAADRLARVGNARTMRSIIEEAILFVGPTAYYPLGEPEGEVAAGETSGNGGMPLAIRQLGAGGTLEFGTATGPPTDSLPAPTFTPASSAAGKHLEGTLRPTVGGFSSVTLRANFLTSTVATASIVRLMDPFGSQLDLGIDSTGHLSAFALGAFSEGVKTFNLASAAVVTDGLTHDACVTLSRSGSTITATLYLDGSSVASTSYTSSFIYGFTRIRIGGDSAVLFTGTISHVAAFNEAITPTEVATIQTATSTGFEGESSDARIARYAEWAGIAADEQILDAGSSTSIAFTDTTGVSLLQAMQDVAETEGGRLFVDGAGRLVFHSRSRQYANPDAMVSVPAKLLDESSRFVLSTQGLVNDATGQRPSGPPIHASNEDSIAEYGVFGRSTTLLVTSDTEVADAVNWMVASNSEPQVRMPQAGYDAYTEPTAGASLRRMELGDRVTVTDLPTQALASTVDLITEGFTQNISLTSWTITANTTNYTAVQGFVLDDAVYGELDSDSRLIY